MRGVFPRSRPGQAGLLRSLVVTLGLLTGGILAAPGSAAGDPPVHPTLRDFLPSGKYVFAGPATGDTKPTLFYSQPAAAYLVRGTSLGAPLLVRTGTSALESLPEAAILTRPDGGCDVKADAQTTSLGTYTLEGSDIVIKVKGLEGRLQPNPPLLGWLKASAIEEHTPEYLRDAKDYSFDADTLTSIRCDNRKTRVFVYFGSWCPTCSLLMGRILRLEKEVTKDRSNVTFDYYGLPNPPAMYDDPEVKQRGIDRLPMVYVYMGDDCCGRAWGTAWSKPETTFCKIMKGERVNR